jgi:hypothetical protein
MVDLDSLGFKRLNWKTSQRGVRFKGETYVEGYMQLAIDVTNAHMHRRHGVCNVAGAKVLDVA